MAFNPESQMFENLDIDQAYRNAERMIEHASIKLDDFRGKEGYTDSQVEKDKEEIAESEEEFKKKTSPEQNQVQKLATVFEAIIHQHAELSNWFGPDAFTVKTSRFDDVKNGVDTVVEFPESEVAPTYLALAIDVTFSADTEKKFERIKQEIDLGKPTHVEYFVSEHTPHRRLERIPRVVIGAEAGTVKKLSELWLEGDKRALGNHPIQFQILEEIDSQLKAFERYAERTGKAEVAKIYGRERKLVEKILSQKSRELKDDGDRDSVFYAIGRQLNAFR